MSEKKSSSIFEKIAPVLVVATIILALAVSFLWIKVVKLENSGTTTAGTGTTEDSPLSVKNLKKYAKDLKLNTKDFNNCLDNGEKAQKVADDSAYGGTIGVSGTPAFFVNGHLVSGAQPYAVFKTVIDFELAGGNWAKPSVELKALIDQGSVSSEKIAVNFDGSNVEGSNDAKVQMVEFSDFECPFCTRFYKETYAQIKKDYVDLGKIKLSFRHFPLTFHPYAQKSAEASECAASQGKFWEFHNKLFSSQ